MTIFLVEAQLRVCTDRAVMPGVILAFVMPPTADTGQSGVTFPDVGVEGLLGLSCEVAEGFYCEASDFKLVFLFALLLLSSSFYGLYGLLVRFLS
ncbi:Uncharacterised protein [Serratia entomophila]|nr:Uncharacterised protein [Serratia entomophila]